MTKQTTVEETRSRSGLGTDDAEWNLRIPAWDKIRLVVSPLGIIDLTPEGAERLAEALRVKAAAARRPARERKNDEPK